MANYIDTNIIINFRVPEVLLNLFLDAEEADKNDDYGLYLNLADTIDVLAKNCYTEGLISEAQWDLITRRYQI